jgi:hypothetical protein
MPDPRLVPLVLSDDERRTLENWSRRRSTAQGVTLRARIVLACADGGSNTAVAWRVRFLARRLDGLGDEPGPGVPRARACPAPSPTPRWKEWWSAPWKRFPRGPRTGPGGNWPAWSASRRPGVHRIWRSFGLQPHRTEDFKISPDPLLIDKIRDVVGLYLAPRATAVVFVVDE